MKALLLIALLTTTLSTDLAAQTYQVYGDWYYSEKVDETTDEYVEWAFSLALERTLSNQDARVGVQCWGDWLSAFINFDEFLDSTFVSMRWQFDDGEVHEAKGWTSADGTAVFLSQVEELHRHADGTVVFLSPSEEFIENVQRSSVLVAEARDVNGVTHRLRFSLKGSTEAIGHLRCLP